MTLVASCSGVYFPEGETVDNIVTLTWQPPDTALEPYSVVLLKVKSSAPQNFYVLPRYGAILATDSSGNPLPQRATASIAFGLRPSEGPTQVSGGRLAVEQVVVSVDAATYESLAKLLLRPKTHNQKAVEAVARGLWEQGAVGSLRTAAGPPVYLQAYAAGVVRLQSETTAGSKDDSIALNPEEALDSGANGASSNTTAVISNSGSNGSGTRPQRSCDVGGTDSSEHGGTSSGKQVVVPPDARLVPSIFQKRSNHWLRRSIAVSGCTDVGAAGLTATVGTDELQELKTGIRALRYNSRTEGATRASQMGSAEMSVCTEELGVSGAHSVTTTAAASVVSVNGSDAYRRVATCSNPDVDVITRMPTRAEMAASMRRKKGVPLVAVVIAMVSAYATAVVLSTRINLTLGSQLTSLVWGEDPSM